MAAAGLCGSLCGLHWRLFKLQPITEFSLVRWASKKAGEFLYYTYFCKSCVLHVLVWNTFAVIFDEVRLSCGET
jgi:hypothetical protein